MTTAWRQLKPVEMKEMAARIIKRANAGHDVMLTPGTALLFARMLSIYGTRPMRFKIIAAMCQIPQCKNRRDCMECIMKANAVERLYQQELEWLVEHKESST